MTDIILGLLALALLLGVIAAALWPPHKHSYPTKVAEQIHDGKTWQLWQCVCGKQKAVTYAKDDSDPAS